MALEYAYQLREKSPETSVFWIHAAKFEQGYTTIAKKVNIPGVNDPATSKLGLVKSWLDGESSGLWLMIIDNADDGDAFFGCNSASSDSRNTEAEKERLVRYISQSSNGSILLTTRNKQVGLRLKGYGDIIRIPAMSSFEAKSLFMSKLKDVPVEQAPVEELLALLAYLPLAIVQAAAYISWNSVSVAGYLKRYHESESAPLELLDTDFEDFGREEDSMNPVFRTWGISFDQIQREKEKAAGLLSIMSFLGEGSIPESLLGRYIGSLGKLQEALGVLEGFLLVILNHDASTVNLHRLVRICTRGWLTIHGKQNHWANATTSLLSQAFPDGEPPSWESCAALLPHAQAVLQVETPVEVPIERATLQFHVATYLETQGHYEAAEDLHRKAAELRQQKLGKNHQDTLKSYSSYAFVLWRRGRHEQVEKLHREALLACEESLGRDHPDTLASCSNLVCVLWDLCQYKEAEELNQRAVEGYNRHGKSSRQALRALSNFCVFRCMSGDYSDAERIAREVLKRRQQTLKENHPDVLRSMHLLATILEVEGRYEEAEATFQQVLRMREELLTRKHPNTLQSLSRLASLLLIRGKYQAAHDMQKKAFEGFSEVLGKEHPQTLECQAGLILILLSQGKAGEAEEMSRRSIHHQEEVLGKNHPSVLASKDNLAWVLQDQRKYTEAEALYQQTLKEREEMLGKKHPDTLTSLSNLADVLWGQHKYTDADELHRHTLKEREEVLGKKHPDTLTSLSNLAGVLWDQHKYTDAEELYRQILKEREEVLGKKHPGTSGPPRLMPRLRPRPEAQSRRRSRAFAAAWKDR